MKRLALLFIIGIVFTAGVPVSKNTKPTFRAGNKTVVESKLIGKVDNGQELPANQSSTSNLDKTYFGSDDINAYLSGNMKDSNISKEKAAQIKVTPSCGSYLGGCAEKDYFVEINGARFGNGWDINSVTICGVEVCHIFMQSSNVVIVYPNAASPGTGDIVITSESMGKTTIKNAFTYQAEGLKNQVKEVTF